MQPIGASPFWRRVAGMRDACDRDRDLRGRSGESTRASTETGEREAAGRLTETETRFTDGEKIQHLSIGERTSDSRVAARESRAPLLNEAVDRG
jgi:hypothetical protein